jgi:hypothetical protein
MQSLFEIVLFYQACTLAATSADWEHDIMMSMLVAFEPGAETSWRRRLRCLCALVPPGVC